MHVHAIQRDVYGDKMKYWIGGSMGGLTESRVVSVEMDLGGSNYEERVGWDRDLRQYTKQAQDDGHD